MRFEDVGEFFVTGTPVRTSNAREMTPNGVIPAQWAAMRERPDSGIIAVYTDYESDLHGEYTFVLGSKANANTGVKVPAGRYAVFTSERGPVQKVVVETWQRIWAELPSPDCKRSYVADFEVYDERASDPANAVVDIYVGVH
jgi:predicted transcriptional regulator YdeE